MDDLNLKTASRWSVAAVPLLVVAGLGALVWPGLLLAAAALGLALVGLNRDVYRFFFEKRGLLFALRAVPWHWFSYGYSGVAFLIGLLRHRPGRRAPASSKRG